jgi:hypothetical protein
MTLQQVARAVDASPRWVLNALTRLGVPRRYDEPLARRLALARALHVAAALPLPRAWALARRILAEADYFKDWVHESDDGTVTLTVHLPRFFTYYQTRLSAARTYHVPKRRGPKPPRGPGAVKRAAEYGWDVTLLDTSLERTESERLRHLDEAVGDLSKMRKVSEP